MTTAAAVLAAGAGTRFESALLAGGGEPRHKLLAPFRGRPLLAWAVESALEAAFDAVYVVAGALDPGPVLASLAADRPDLMAPTVVPNPDWALGQATSLATAVDRADLDGHEAVVVGLADQPLVPAGCWRRVARTAGDIVTATFEGRPRPPVKFDRSVWSQLPRTGDEGARTLLQMRPDLVSQVVCSGNPMDIDTPEDLRQWS